MGTVHKIGNEYYIEFEARGLKYQQKAGADEKAAWKLLAEVEGKIRQGEMGTLVRDVDYDIFLKDFLDYIKPQHTIKTFERFRCCVEHFGKFLSERQPLKKLSQLTPKVIEDYKASLLQKNRKPVNPKIINLTIFLLREVFEYAIKLGYLNDNPTLHIKFVNSPGGALRVLTKQEEATLMSSKAGERGTFYQLVLWTGAKVQEVRQLRWSSVDLIKGSLLLGSESGSPRSIPLTAPLIQTFKNLEPVRRHSNDKIFADLDFGNLTEEVEISCVALRHTFAHHLINKGISLVKLAYYLGLDDVGKTMFYFCFLKEAAKKRCP